MTTDETKAPKRDIPKWQVNLTAAAIIAAIALCAWGVSRDDESTGEFTAQAVCEDFVRDRLKAPATAEFSNIKRSGSGPNWTVTGTVDAENLFGAKLRMNWSCSLRLDGDTWRLVSLTGLS